MFKYDSTYGVYDGTVSSFSDKFVVDEMEINCVSSPNPIDIPWDRLDVDIVLECTGKFTDAEKARQHIDAGAKKVIISAPAKGEDVTVVMGVNESDYDPVSHSILSNASCTTNCVAPLMKVLEDQFGIISGMMTTIHSYTNDQQVLDKRHKDMRRARAAGTNIIPTTTGAAKAVGQVIPALEGKVHGMAFRVPTATVSVTDVVATLESSITPDVINQAYINASEGSLNGILDFTLEPLVSSDYRKNKFSCVIDGLSTITLGTNMVKVVGWYDNEWGYSLRTIDMARYVAAKGFH
jgi:glyceraldehyde 3-phosphate dehydrogenase